MVKNIVTEELLEQLRNGVTIPVKDGEPYIAVPDSIELVTDVTDHYMHMDDFRQQYPHTWLLMTLTEGKFHQVRKMCLAINRRCQRLIRISIEELKLGDLKPGCVKELKEQEFFELIDVDYPAKT
jgi:23S rRNA pseudouridine2457 synthase